MPIQQGCWENLIMYCFEHWAIMLGCYSAVSVQSRGNFNDYQCFSFTLPLARAAQAKIQMLTAICSIVKLLPWNLVNLSHLYKIIPMLLWNGLHPIVSRPNLKATAPSSISSIKILMERSSRKRKKKMDSTGSVLSTVRKTLPYHVHCIVLHYCTLWIHVCTCALNI